MTATLTVPSTALRDALASLAYEAAKHRAQTDRHQARALVDLTVAIEMACCDDTALAVLASAPKALRDEITGATTGEDLIAAITGGGDGSE